MHHDPLRPPPIALHLAVGVTGHRQALADEAQARIATLLATLARAAERLRAREAASFADRPAALRLVTALAEGTDQAAADAALAAGYVIQTILPLPPEDYASDFTQGDAAATLQRLLAASTCRLELSPSEGPREHAYVLAGRAVVAHSDMLIAIWDGQPARGRGGTAEVVEHALNRAVPVLHIPVDPAEPPRILWPGYDPLVEPASLADMPARTLDETTIDALVTALLAPPAEPAERGFLADFLAERERTTRLRVEYPLLLAATGARGLRRTAWRTDPYLRSTREEFAAFRAMSESDLHDLGDALDPIEAGYAWSDRLAQHFAQTYRSGHVFNFLLGAGAVLLALSGLLLPDAKLWLVAAELAVIVAFIVNTQVGTRRGWHRRWLDYRQLAERLRPMRSLKLLGAAGPVSTRRGAGPAAQRWVDWYAAGIWRQSGCPSGRMPADVDRLIGFVVAQEIDPQMAYHRASAHQMHHLDHSLHRLGMTLFIVSIVSCLTFVAAYVLAHEWSKQHAVDFIVLSAGLPALGAAIFGIRMQGDFIGSAERSASTADALTAIRAALLTGGVSLPRAVDLGEAAARTMLADLGEWRLAYQQRRLELPG